MEKSAATAKPRVLIDLDCVLADFVGGVCRLWDLTPGEALAAWEPGSYGMEGPVGRALYAKTSLSDANVPPRAMTLDEFWRPINDAGAGFWADLPPLPWFRELVGVVSRFTDDWHVITSPSWCPTSYDGKVQWLKREFYPRFDRFAITPHKEIFAGPNVLLIDDYDGNCEKFRAAGGHPVTFPVHHNHLHELAGDPLRHVAECLDYFTFKGRTP